MPKTVTPRELVKLIEKLGFQRTRITGSHHQFSHSDGRKVTVPIHGNEPIGPGLLNKIIKKDLEMDKKEFFKTLEKL